MSVTKGEGVAIAGEGIPAAGNIMALMTYHSICAGSAQFEINNLSFGAYIRGIGLHGESSCITNTHHM